jgi:SAM-dependent methyltransferase
MTDRGAISRQMRDHYESVWRRGDAWEFESSQFEQRRFAYLLDVLQGRHYAHALEIGCGSGCFTRLLATIADQVVALDIAPSAIERARAHIVGAGPGSVDLRVADVMALDLGAEGPWDLVVLSETIYSLGWLYPFFDVGLLAARLFEATCPAGLFLLTNTYGPGYSDWLLRPWLIDTYRDLFRNVGFHVNREEIFRGTKDGVEVEVLVSLFEKPAADPAQTASGQSAPRIFPRA